MRGSAKSQIAFALYLPVLGIVGYYTLLSLLLLARGQKVGLYAFPYAAVIWVLASRASKIQRGQVEPGDLWKHIAAMSVANFLLAGVAASSLF